MARVLVVEDDGLVRRSVHRCLERAGHEVWETAGGKVALKLLKQMPVDVVITDLYMPGMNGFELIETLAGRHDRRPVIAMSGGGFRSSEEMLAQAGAMGADLTLKKPFDVRELLGAVDAAIRVDARRNNAAAS